MQISGQPLNFDYMKMILMVKRMCSSQYYWGDSENDGKEIIDHLKTRASEEAT